MEILHEKSIFPQQASLILGFFDGIHAGHRDVLKNTPENKKVVVTFSSSPAEYFKQDFCYIYPREFNYSLIKSLGVDYIYEQNFTDIAHLSAEEYLAKLISKFNPITITTGFNHTFGAKRQGNSEFLEIHQKSYKYFSTPPTKIDSTIVSSSRIKEFLATGDIQTANKFLGRNFSLESQVIHGAKVGRKLGFPTANLIYPDKIVKIPYGVYKVKVLNKPAILNWGIKPTFGAKETLEVHIPNFHQDLYGQNLTIEFISKIRDEIKFSNTEELKEQIKKDIEICLK